ncbi:murein hydrolase activator EnvC [Adlercreutzia sp. ZJ138]|uniref:murein hydrolase activator EnvC family protein n=1 Tax=Adlercreutzia sp. ZJ138 TaxID=2709405 RepID=UPI0013EDA580|nr:M23 family metallopeptidase [Adlercreutzia sp. ZJ138]
MNEISPIADGISRRTFLKACGIAGGTMLFPWLAYASEAEELEAQASSLEETAAAKQAEVDALAARLDALQTQLNEALERYTAADEAHTAAVEAMEAAQERIKAAEERLAELQERLGNRASAIYREGEPTALNVIFGSQSFEEFVTNWDAAQRIAKQDADLVQETKDVKAEAEAAHAEYAKQEAIAAEELENARVAKEEVEATQASLQAEYDSMSSDLAALHSEIEQVRMSAEEARQKEEEAKALAQQALAQQMSGGSSGGGGGSSAAIASPGSSSAASNVGGWVNPAPGYGVTSGFGWRSLGDFHLGVDLGCPSGTTICAMAAGRVTTAGWFGSGGIAVTIDHGGGIVSWYLHNTSTLVSVGQQVSAGQPISISGNTGYSFGAHLHFQINLNSSNGVNGSAVDPRTYFSW